MGNVSCKTSLENPSGKQLHQSLITLDKIRTQFST